MKKLSFFSILCFGIVLFSCEKTNYNCTASYDGDTVQVKYNKNLAVFPNCPKEFNAKVMKIADSRCPINAICIWGGTVSVELSINDKNNILLGYKTPKDTIMNNTKYTFNLTEVAPYPFAGMNYPNENYVATIEIKAQ